MQMATSRKPDTGLTIVGGSAQPTEVDPAPQPTAEIKTVAKADESVLDEFERLAADTILDDDDGDEPGAKDEIAAPLVEKNLPRFANFMSSPVTFALWGVTDRQGMDDLIVVTTKSFAPNFDEDVDLRRVRFFETVTAPDGVTRLVWCFEPERQPQTQQLDNQQNGGLGTFAETVDDDAVEKKAAAVHLPAVAQELRRAEIQRPHTCPMGCGTAQARNAGREQGSPLLQKGIRHGVSPRGSPLYREIQFPRPVR